MAFTRGANVVTDGLVLYLDAANPKSFINGTTNWRDMSGNGMIASMSGSVPFNNTLVQGTFTFGNQASFIIPENSTLNTQTPTVEVWTKTNATTQNGFWFEKGNVNTQYALFQEGANITWRHYFSNLSNFNSLIVPAASYINTIDWFQVVGTFTSGVRRIYINGALVGSDSQTGTLNTNANGMSIGVFGGFNGVRGYYYNGNISSVKVYNRALTAEEVQQNYNAQKSRFNL